MEIKLILSIIASFIAVVGFVPYFINIFKRKTEPHIFSWLVWSILQIVATFAHFKAGGGYGSYPLMIGAFFCFSIFLLSFKYGTKNIKTFDLFCLISALLIIFLYIFIENSIYAIILIVFIDFIAFLPTFRKGYQEPNTETNSLYFLSTIANILGIIATQNYNYITILYPASLAITNFLFFVMILLRRRAL